MFAKLATTLVVLSLVFGGGSLTAYAAQGSMPDDALYSVKLLTEDLRFEMSTDTSLQVELLTTYANRRVDEIASLVNEGEPIPDLVLVRLEDQLDTMLSLFNEMDEDEISENVKYIQIHLRDRDQLMTMVGSNQDTDPKLAQIQNMLTEQHRIASLGTEEPLTFRQMFRQNNDMEDPVEPPDPQSGDQYGGCEEPGGCAGDGDGSGAGPQAGSGEPAGPAGPKQTPEPDSPGLGPEFKNGQPDDDPEEPPDDEDDYPYFQNTPFGQGNYGDKPTQAPAQEESPGAGGVPAGPGPGK